MALLTKSEFARACGMASNALSVYVKRGKVIMTGDHVDDSMAENKEFLRKRAAKGKINPPVAEVHVPAIDPEPEKEFIPPEIDVEDVDEYIAPNMSYQSLEALNKELDAKKKAEEIAILKIKKDKQRAVVVPTAQVRDMVSRLTKSMVVEFNNSIEKIITKFSKRKHLDNNEVAEIRAELIAEINTASDKAIDEAIKEVKQIAEAFGEKRGKGERK